MAARSMLYRPLMVGAFSKRDPCPSRRARPDVQGAFAMTSRPRFFDDLAGLAGGALSAVSGLREEVEALVRARVEETLRRLDVARREDLDVALELAATARDTQAALQARVDALEQRVAALEAGPVSVAQQDKPSGA
ncbi:Hypothetical protein GbCGDNIH7_2309 [Granulibacter bethesdensis]|nr:Hypothetical protein GbCGDNIH7_2309 [Granulibacter bethesdensis]